MRKIRDWSRTVTTFEDQVTGFALELLRSLWAELGVDGAPRRHEWQALDIEPLVIFTLVWADVRLRAKVLDWCTRNSSLLSIARLNHFVGSFGGQADAIRERYSSSLAANPAHTSGSAAPDLTRPALIQLRLRALFGVSARAEVVKLLLANPEEAPALARRAGYGAGGLTQALDMLTLGGVIHAEQQGKHVTYRLNRPGELGQAVSGVPADSPDWTAILKVTAAILVYARAPEGERSSAAAHAARSIRRDIGYIPGAAGPPKVTAGAAAEGFEDWACAFLGDQASGAGPSPQREVLYTVHRLLLGGWIATVKESGDQPRPLALSDDPELQQDRRARRRLKLDEVGAAAEMIESMFVDIRTRELRRRQGSLVPRQSLADSEVPALSRVFAAELLEPLHKGQAAVFTEEFLQRWSAGRRDRLSAAG